MTIYTSKSSEKKEQLIPPPEVVTEHVPEKKKILPPPPPCPNLVTITTRRRRSNCANFCVLLTALVVLATGIIGGIYLYKHLAHRTFRGWCSVRYYDYQNQNGEYGYGNDAYGQHGQHGYHNRVEGQFEEKVEIDKENGRFEKIEVPEFEECKRATILHDFEKNLTAIVDKDNGRCFVVPLNRTMVKPPKDFWDLIVKLKTGYYLPDAEVVRQRYRVQLPAVENRTPFGYYIYRECRYYDTYRLERMAPGRALSKRAAVEGCPVDNDYNTFSMGSVGSEKLNVAVFEC